MRPSVPLQLLLTLLLAALSAPFTITMTDKTEGGDDPEEDQRVRPNFGHWWILIKDQSIQFKNGSLPTLESPVDEEDEVDAMSVVWYLGAFGGLIAFFLVVTCSEWCCSRHYGGRPCDPPPLPPPHLKPQTPPPPYHLFAPPPYTESLDKPSVYVVPVPS